MNYSKRGEEALRLVQMGFRVFRLHGILNDGCDCTQPDCPKPGKHPIAGGWSKLATTDPDVIAHWWDRTPGANVGIVTGIESDILVLDVDGETGHQSLVALEREYALLPDSPRVNTGRGYHIYFRANGSNLRGSVSLLGPKLDVRANGNYVVGPSSRHASGSIYEWDVGCHPDDIEFAEMPEWLVQLASERRRSRAKGMATHGERILEGERNNRLFKVACKMRRIGMTCDMIYVALSVVNTEHCDPPFPDKDVARIAKSASKYAPAYNLFE